MKPVRSTVRFWFLCLLVSIPGAMYLVRAGLSFAHPNDGNSSHFLLPVGFILRGATFGIFGLVIARRAYFSVKTEGKWPLYYDLVAGLFSLLVVAAFFNPNKHGFPAVANEDAFMTLVWLFIALLWLMGSFVPKANKVEQPTKV